MDFSFPTFSSPTDLKVADHLVYGNASLAKHPLLSKLVYTCRYGRFVEILETNGAQITKRIPIFNKYPIYKVKGSNFKTEDNCLQGAVTQVTKNRIYCLLTPYTKKEAKENTTYKGMPNYYSDELHVFDWDGKLIKTYQLDMPICSFCVDETDSILLGSTLQGEDFAVRKYKLD